MKERKRKGVMPTIHLVWKQMNPCFSCVCSPRWDDPSLKARYRLACHFVIEKLHWDDKKHRQLQLPAHCCQVFKSNSQVFPGEKREFLSATMKWGFYPDDWWRIFTSVVIHGQRLPPFFCSPASSFFHFSPISLCPAIHVFMFSLCANSVMIFSSVLNSQLFASWHNMKGRTTAADRDASFIFINQTTVECSRMEGKTGGGGSDSCRKS